MGVFSWATQGASSESQLLSDGMHGKRLKDAKRQQSSAWVWPEQKLRFNNGLYPLASSAWSAGDWHDKIFALPKVCLCFSGSTNTFDCQALSGWLCSVQSHACRVGQVRMNELVLNLAGKLKRGVMPPCYNEYFPASLTDVSNPTPFKVGHLLLNTHAHTPTHNNTISFTAYTCERLGFLVETLTIHSLPDLPRQGPGVFLRQHNSLNLSVSWPPTPGNPS